jgi:hypothetical protein
MLPYGAAKNLALLKRGVRQHECEEVKIDNGKLAETSPPPFLSPDLDLNPPRAAHFLEWALTKKGAAAAHTTPNRPVTLTETTGIVNRAN